MRKLKFKGLKLRRGKDVTDLLMLAPGDPKYKPPRINRRHYIVTPSASISPKSSARVHSSRYKKVLTKTKRKRIMELVTNITRKDDKKMTEITKTKKAKKANWRGVEKSIAWLIEAGFRGFVGWVLLSNFDNIAATAAAIYALGTAGIIVVMHFVRANRK